MTNTLTHMTTETTHITRDHHTESHVHTKLAHNIWLSHWITWPRAPMYHKTIKLNHMTTQSSHIIYDYHTQSHDQTKLAHITWLSYRITWRHRARTYNRRGKKSSKWQEKYILCEVHHDGVDGMLQKDVPLCNTQWYNVVTASVRFLGGSRFLTSSQQSYTQNIIANVLYLWPCPSMVQRVRTLMINWARVGNKLIEAMSIVCIEVSFCYKQIPYFCAKPYKLNHTKMERKLHLESSFRDNSIR